MKFNAAAWMERMIRSVDNVVWELTSGKIGLVVGDQIVAINYADVETKPSGDVVATNPTISLNPMMDFGMPIPAFAQATPSRQLNIGDLVYSSTDKTPLGWIVGVLNDHTSFQLITPQGYVQSWVPPVTNSLISFDAGVMILRNMVNALPGGSTQMGQLQGMLMPMMLSGMLDGESDLKSIMPLLLMQGGMGGADGGMTGNMMSSMMQMMLMQKFMNGGSKSIISPINTNPFRG